MAGVIEETIIESANTYHPAIELAQGTDPRKYFEDIAEKLGITMIGGEDAFDFPRLEMSPSQMAQYLDEIGPVVESMIASSGADPEKDPIVVAFRKTDGATGE